MTTSEAFGALLGVALTLGALLTLAFLAIAVTG